ncbi:HIT domain-containing protein [Candidatus Woesearchaeota archaeon]|nr:HIT domain-containing protein [Candidatus Woesearchaeota archaeon]
MELQLEQVIIRDEELVVFFPEETIVEGELVVAPIHAFKTLEDIPEALIEKMFHVVNKMSSSLFDLLGCHGTNLLIQNGEIAGQKSESLFIRIIPRFQDDSLQLKWDSSPSSPEDLENVVKSFKDADEEKIQEAYLEEQKKQATQKVPEEEQNDYLLKSLKRNP